MSGGDQSETAKAGLSLAAIALVVTRAPYDAWAIKVLWNWFIAPLGVMRITFWQAWGIDCFVALFIVFMVRPRGEDTPAASSFAHAIGKWVAVSLTLLTGLAIHHFGHAS